MQSFADHLRRSASNLKPVKTNVLLENGLTVQEERDEKGEFAVVFETEDDTPDQLKAEDSSARTCSRRQRKLVERAHRYGFIIDLNPDLQVAEVSKGIFLSSQDVAQELPLLKRHGITHIVNVATAVKIFFPKQFVYLQFKALDCPTQDLSQYFNEATLFMRKAVEQGGNCLVHCNAGISRSSTLCIVYIMVTENKRLSEALQQVKSVRPVARPNEGFMRQLEQFEKGLNYFGRDVLDINISE
uniref:Dual specificity protein phosphatase 19 n=1 Tax=Ditylenchus dipsaci TaxID=166011 RepID=A0A915CSJ6_9BILA